MTSDDDGDHINTAIPDYNTAFDELLRGIKTAGFNIGTSLQSYSGEIRSPDQVNRYKPVKITKHVASTCVLDITKDEVDVMTFAVTFVEVVMAFAKSKGPQNLLSLTTWFHASRERYKCNVIGCKRSQCPDIREGFAEITAPLVNQMCLVNNNNAPARTKPAVLSEYLELVGPKGLGGEGNDLVLAFPGLFPEIAAELCGSS
jgi:hypothetical protein